MSENNWLKKRNRVRIVIPTFNNMDMLLSCVKSILSNTVGFYSTTIVNNGSKELEKYLINMDIIYNGENKGWMGGINAALKELPDECEYVVLMNDDTLVLPNAYDWLDDMVSVMDNDPEVGAVGPSSNVVAGLQNIRHMGLPALVCPKFLIGFCVVIRRELLDKMGGLDESLPGGDDLDWSIQIRNMGYKLVIRRDVFVHHHGFVTGTKVHGGPEQERGWNSPKMTEETNLALIKKHGFKKWYECIRNVPEVYDICKEEYGDLNAFKDIVRGKGIDVGCGPSKISPETIGVDLAGSGEENYQGSVSQADIKASGDEMPFRDGEMDYVVARHNIEHYSNPIKALKEWHRVLKVGGKLGIATPDDRRVSGLKLDETHKHSWNREGMKDLLELCGFHVDEVGGSTNGWNMYAIATKPFNKMAEILCN